MSFRNVAPGMATSPFGAPVFGVEHAHDADVRDVEHPLDDPHALGRVELHLVLAALDPLEGRDLPSGERAEMKPLLSLSVGLPLMFDTR